MTTLYVQHDGCTLTRQDNSLVVKYPTSDNLPAARIPIEKISHVVIGAGCHVTSGALGLLLAMAVPINIVDYHDNVLGSVLTPLNGNHRLRQIQYTYANRDDICLYFAQKMLSAKIKNQRTLIRRYAKQHPRLAEIIDEMQHLAAKIEHTADVPTTMGYEGQAAKRYFEGLSLIFGEAWNFTGRNRRPPRDPINAMLSYGYTILEGRIVSAIHRTGMDPSVGFMHATFPGRRSLALDLIEEFRPVIVDSVILGIVGNQMLTPSDFEITLGTCQMPEKTRKTFLQRFQQRLDQSVKHPITEHSTTYDKLIQSQALQLASLLLNDIGDYVPVRIR